MSNWSERFENGRAKLLADSPLASEAVDRIDGSEMLEAALPSVSSALAAEAARDLSHIVQLVDSPIEEAMILGLCVVGLYSADRVQVVEQFKGSMKGERLIGLGGDEYAPTVVTIHPQFRVGRYRTDFMLTVRNRWGFGDSYVDGSILLECDGHDFHEKSKAQAKRDKQRDRALQSAGFEVHHFTGSEIWDDPIGCAREAIERAEDRATSSAPWNSNAGSQS
jgi:very-short-patch-repair endonuclease